MYWDVRIGRPQQNNWNASCKDKDRHMKRATPKVIVTTNK